MLCSAYCVMPVEVLTHFLKSNVSIHLSVVWPLSLSCLFSLFFFSQSSRACIYIFRPHASARTLTYTYMRLSGVLHFVPKALVDRKCACCVKVKVALQLSSRSRLGKASLSRKRWNYHRWRGVWIQKLPVLVVSGPESLMDRSNSCLHRWLSWSSVSSETGRCSVGKFISQAVTWLPAQSGC